ncbi:MAG: MotA/TolQ/ExbB proton channel family protein [Planctomycetaceae bacterium]|nr:MotA/TolQ/ExbB proton channel family protein [Planctomycetaceae bacterium]
MDVNDLAKMMGDACYGFLAINFFWGLYHVVMGFRRVKRFSFKSKQQQAEFLDQLMQRIEAGKYDEAAQMCEDDERALPQLAHMAILNRGLGFEPMRQSVAEVLQRDVLGELEYRTSWIATVIKSGPLLGLFGTVLGMMAAFGRIGTGEQTTPATIAAEISIALICTAMGLATAIPFNFFLASISVRIRRLQDSLAAGMVRILDLFKQRGV